MCDFGQFHAALACDGTSSYWKSETETRACDPPDLKIKTFSKYQD